MESSPPNGLFGVISRTKLARLCGNNIKPNLVIGSVSGPNSLDVGQTGNWRINASAQNGSTLTYSVNWGDSNYPSTVGTGGFTAMANDQAAGFSHSYSQAGTYTVRFMVDSNTACTSIVGQPAPACNTHAESSITVTVGGNQNTDTDKMRVTIALLEKQILSICSSNPTIPLPIIPDNASVSVLQSIISSLQQTLASCSNNYQPSITITSPNGGEVWPMGETRTISWQTAGGGDNVIVQLVFSDGAVCRIGNLGVVSSMQFNTNYQCPNIPRSVMPGQYKIQVILAGNGNSSDIGIDRDLSDNYFTIVPATTVSAPAITGVSPSSGASGSTFLLSGSNFTSTGNQTSFSCSSVSSGGGQVNLSSANGRTLSATVPAFAVISGSSINYPINCNVTVSNAYGVSNSIPFTITSSGVLVPASPAITNIVPGVGTVNSTITVYGINLTGASNILFYQNGVQKGSLASIYNLSAISRISVQSPNQLTFILSSTDVANLASSVPYNISVVTPAGTSAPDGPFTISAATTAQSNQQLANTLGVIQALLNKLIP